MKRNWNIRLAGLFATGSLLLLAGCSSGVTKNAEQMTSFSGGARRNDTAQLFTVPAEQMSHVQVATVTEAPLQRTLRLAGSVAYNAFRTTPVISPVGGPVSRILVNPGDFVKQEQPLLEVTSPDYAMLRASFLKARDTLRVADKNYARAQDLYAHHAIAERDLLQAESDQNQAQADVNANKQSLRALGIAKPEELATLPSTAEIPLRAPIGGEVVERLVSPGQLLQAGATQAFTISDLSTVWVLVNVAQADLAPIRTGEKVTIRTDAYPDDFGGVISYVAPELDPATRTVQARIVVENPGDKLKKDMYVTATVDAGTIANALSVPDAAVLRDTENMPFVYIVMGRDAQGAFQFGRRLVQVGESQNGRTQILSGVKAGDRVAGDGSLFLQFANSLQQ